MSIKKQIRRNQRPAGTFSLSDSAAQAIAHQLKALAHPVRLQILQHLEKSEKCYCNDFCANIPLAQSTISQHLKILNNAGIIDYKPVGNCSQYSLNPEALDQAVQALQQISKNSGISICEEMPDFPTQESKEV